MNNISGASVVSANRSASAAWDSRAPVVRNHLLRRACAWLSFRRLIVDECALHTKPGSLVLDAGSGTGVFSYWFLDRTAVTVIAVDRSKEALTRFVSRPLRSGQVLKVCADLRFLPFKETVFDALVSLDALGRGSHPAAVLDEFLRTTKPGAVVAIHSECSDYQAHWPDSMLIRKLGYDPGSWRDGPPSRMSSAGIRQACLARFGLVRFFSPADVLGWLTAYPEKYRPAFVAAGLRIPALLVAMFAFVKHAPVAGFLLRVFNAIVNQCEIAFVSRGGGSCFALLTRPEALQPFSTSLPDAEGR